MAVTRWVWEHQVGCGPGGKVRASLKERGGPRAMSIDRGSVFLSLWKDRFRSGEEDQDLFSIARNTRIKMMTMT